jgi:hypothetical protein
MGHSYLIEGLIKGYNVRNLAIVLQIQAIFLLMLPFAFWQQLGVGSTI